MPEPDENAIELDDEGKPLAGVKAKQAAVEYLKSVLEQVLDFFSGNSGTYKRTRGPIGDFGCGPSIAPASYQGCFGWLRGTERA